MRHLHILAILLTATVASADGRITTVAKEADGTVVMTVETTFADSEGVEHTRTIRTREISNPVKSVRQLADQIVDLDSQIADLQAQKAELQDLIQKINTARQAP